MIVFRQVPLVGCRIRGHDRFPDDIFVVEVHPQHTHVAAGVELEQVALREVVAVLHHGGAGHILVLAVLKRHITYRGASEDGEIALPYAARVVQREMEVATEHNRLRIFPQYRRQRIGRPVMRKCGVPYSTLLTETAAIDGVLDHRMGDHDDIFLRLGRGDGGQLVVKPSDDRRVIDNRLVSVRRDAQDVIIPDYAVTCLVLCPHLLILVCLEIIVSEHIPHISDIRDHCGGPGISRNIVITNCVDHRSLLHVNL